MRTKYFILLLALLFGTIVRATNFISDIRVSTHEKEATAKSQLTNAGYTVIEQDMNQGGGGHYVFIGYKTSTNLADAITGHQYDEYGVCTRTAGEKHYSHAQGDVTLDGRISIADIAKLLYAILNGHWANADYNDDGVIDLNDIETLVNVLLSNE